MAYWYESSIDRQLREAAERGDFDNLPGTGRPLSDHGTEYDEDWWVKDWLRREGATAGVIPASLAVRRAVQDVDDTVDRLRTEAQVREWVAELNERIRKARVGLVDGPPVVLPPIDVERAVAGWRARRAPTSSP